MQRTILHCDLNNFYASVECLYHPEIRDKPVAVCGSQSTRHGIVLAKNYIAKSKGVKTGDAIWEAKDKCPDLVIVQPDFSAYLKFSREAREIYKQYTDQVEAFGIDENWLDVTESTKLFGNGKHIAEEIRQRVKDELGVTVSVGVSFNKIFAKLASDMKKPDAVTPITEENFKEKTWGLPVGDLLYVGSSTLNKLNKLAIYTIGDLARSSSSLLTRQLGKWGEILWYFANGYESTPVTRLDYESSIKSIGNTLTTPRDLETNEEARLLLYILSESVGERLRKHHLAGRTVQITIRDTAMACIEKQAPLPCLTNVTSEIAEKAYEIFLNSWDWSRNIRLLGVRVTNVTPEDHFVQLSLFTDPRHSKRKTLDICVDSLRDRFGQDSVQRAYLLRERKQYANPVEDHIVHPVSFFGPGKQL